MTTRTKLAPAPTPAEMLTSALSSIPGYTKAARAVATTASWAAPQMPVSDLPGELAALAADGSPLPEDLLDRIAKREARHRATNEARNLLDQTRARAQFELDELVISGSDQAFIYLRERLAEVIGNTRRLAEADAPTDAHDAISRGESAIDAFRELEALAAAYDAIRSAQRKILEQVAGRDRWAIDKGQDRFLRSGLTIDAINHDAYWTKRRADAAVGTDDDDARTQAHREWLARTSPNAALGSPSKARSWWPTNDRVAHLVAIATKARPWIPTIAQLEAADTAATEAIVPVRVIDYRSALTVEEQLKRAARARAQLEDLAETAVV